MLISELDTDLTTTFNSGTDPSAEEEIRLVFGKVGEILVEQYPNIFGDYEVEMVAGIPWYKSEYSKV